MNNYLYTDCPMCGQRVAVIPYFHNERVVCFTDITNSEYDVSVNLKAVCPSCGATINKTYANILSKQDICELALKGREVKK